MTPISVSVLGWMRSATQRPMIARSGNMQIAPIAPVKRPSRPLSRGEPEPADVSLCRQIDAG